MKTFEDVIVQDISIHTDVGSPGLKKVLCAGTN